MTDARGTIVAVSDDGWSIGPRWLPSPGGASDRLRTLLAAEASPAAIRAPTTGAELKAAALAGDEETAALVQKFVTAMGLTVDIESIDGVPVRWVRPAHVAEWCEPLLFVHVHGGAWSSGAGLSGAAEAVEIAAFIGIRTATIDYRMVPDHPAPAAMDDVVAVCGALCQRREPRTMVLGGTSAGANIVLAAMLRMKELGLPMPGALFLGTPACDLATVGDTRFINDGIDHNLVTWNGRPSLAASLYAAELGTEHPYVSPIHGDVSGFPPTYLISGTRDLMLSDTVRTHRKLRQAGVYADLHVYEGLAHADYISHADLPESVEHMRELAMFIAAWLTHP
jgi:epsilon-lactone hydrolase